MKDDIEQRTVDLKTSVIVDKVQFPKFVHEGTDSRTRGAHHLGQRLLANLGNFGSFPDAILPETSEQKNPRKPLLTGIEQLVGQILPDTGYSLPTSSTNMSENLRCV